MPPRGGRPAGGRHRTSLVPPQFPYRPRLATRWRQTSGDGHGHRYPALRRTAPRVPQRGRGTSACPQSRTAAVTSRLQGRAHAGEAEGPRRQRKPTAQVGGGVPFGDPQGGARRGSEVKIQEAAHGGDAWGISLRRDPFPGKRMRTAFLRVDYEGGRWGRARAGCHRGRGVGGAAGGAGRPGASRLEPGAVPALAAGSRTGSGAATGGQARPARCCRGCGAPAPLPGTGSPLVPCPSLLSGPSRLPAFHLPSDKTRA